MSSLEFFRFLLVSMSGLLIGMSITIAYYYGKAWLKAPPRKGLLPLHVWLVSTSYSIFLTSATIELIIRINAHSNPSWRLATYPPAYFLGVFAMWAIWKHGRNQRLRVET